MALRLSEGLLSGLRNFGQQPMAQLNQSLAQPVNTSQALASSLGGMFGVDMRSPAAIQQEQLKSSVGAIKDPSSYEGMVQLAQAVMNIDPIQGAQLLAKAEEMKKAQMAATARSQLQSIQASQAFKALLDIKANDATLGQVSNVELNLLINEVEALTQDMDDETFLQALNNIEQRYLNLVASMSGELQTVPLDSVKEGSKAYLASTNVVRIVDKSGDFRDYPLQVSKNAELGLITKTKDGYFRKGDDGVLTFIPEYLNK
jgi:hypothetical protein